MKTQKEIKEAIKLLRKNKTECHHYSGFGDDNWEALDAMIETLENDYDEEDIYNHFSDELDGEETVQNILDVALEMVFWREGNGEENFEDYLYPVR